MTLRRAVFILVLILIAGAYAAGYWPEHRLRMEAAGQVETLRAQLAGAESRLRLGVVLGRLLRVSDAVAARNYGDAADASSIYFDRVREDAAAVEGADARLVLARILTSRDAVTSALARTDASVSVILREQEVDLRRALGYPVPPTPITAPTPVTEPPPDTQTPSGAPQPPL
jgi:hypothetical protein